MRHLFENTMKSLSGAALAAALAFALPATTALAEGPTAAEYGTVLNLAGRQRMLTQKMSKEFLLVAYGHEADANRLSLLETSGLFDQTLNGLFNGDDVLDLPGNPSATVRAQLDVVKGLWTAMQPIVEAGSAAGSTISPDQIASVAEKNLPLLKEMNKAVGMYEAESKGM